MQVPALEPQRDDEAAHEQDVDLAHVGRAGLLGGQHAGGGQHHERQQRGGGDGDRLGGPPARHEDRQRRHDPPLAPQIGGRLEELEADREREAHDQADATDQARLGADEVARAHADVGSREEPRRTKRRSQ